LLGGDFPRTPRTRRVGQDFEDSFTEPVRLGAFPDAQRLPSISPPFPPHADLLPVQPDFLRNLLVQEPLNPPHQNQRTLHNPLRHRARPTEFLQNRQLLLANPDLCRCPWHSSPPWRHNRGFGRYTRIPDFLKPRFRVVELAWRRRDRRSSGLPYCLLHLLVGCIEEQLVSSVMSRVIPSPCAVQRKVAWDTVCFQLQDGSYLLCGQPMAEPDGQVNQKGWVHLIGYCCIQSCQLAVVGLNVTQ